MIFFFQLPVLSLEQQQKKESKMRIHIIACRVLTRELSKQVADSDNTIGISYLPQGLHDRPAILHQQMIEELERLYDQIEKGYMKRVPDYIVMGYGLCSKSTVGLEAKKIPLVIPRTEDCIALFLGSQERYLKYFSEYPGTFWMNRDWVNNLPDIDPDYEQTLYQKYLEEYEDEDTAEYLMQVHRDSLKNYKMIGFIKSSGVGRDDTERELAKAYADRYRFEYKEFEGNSRLLERIVQGKFDEKEFLIVPPGYKVEFTNGPERIAAVKA